MSSEPEIGYGYHDTRRNNGIYMSEEEFHRYYHYVGDQNGVPCYRANNPDKDPVTRSVEGFLAVGAAIVRVLFGG